MDKDVAARFIKHAIASGSSKTDPHATAEEPIVPVASTSAPDIGKHTRLSALSKPSMAEAMSDEEDLKVHMDEQVVSRAASPQVDSQESPKKKKKRKAKTDPLAGQPRVSNCVSSLIVEQATMGKAKRRRRRRRARKQSQQSRIKHDEIVFDAIVHLMYMYQLPLTNPKLLPLPHSLLLRLVSLSTVRFESQVQSSLLPLAERRAEGLFWLSCLSLMWHQLEARLSTF